MNLELGAKLSRMRAAEAAAQQAWRDFQKLEKEFNEAVIAHLKSRGRDTGVVVVSLPDGTGVLIRVRLGEDYRRSMTFEELVL